MNVQKLPKLDPRLTALAAQVRPGSRTADIGTDHGFLITWLAATGKIPGGFACDINQKPLDKAAFSLSAGGVADKVRLVLGAGLTNLRGEDCDDIIIAGMGGDMIWSILEEVPWTRDERLRFLLQPMTRADHLRRSLYANGFRLEKETAVISGGFPYTVMTAAYTGEAETVTEPFAYGGLLVNAPDAAAAAYLQKIAHMLEERVEGLGRRSRLTEEEQMRLEKERAALAALIRFANVGDGNTTGEGARKQ